MEYYSAPEKILSTDTYCNSNLENIMLSERSQSPNITCGVIQSIWNVPHRQIHRDRKLISDCLEPQEFVQKECKLIANVLFFLSSDNSVLN